jgi:hypothetical protein
VLVLVAGVEEDNEIGTTGAEWLPVMIGLVFEVIPDDVETVVAELEVDVAETVGVDALANGDDIEGCEVTEDEVVPVDGNDGGDATEGEGDDCLILEGCSETESKGARPYKSRGCCGRSVNVPPFKRVSEKVDDVGGVEVSELESEYCAVVADTSDVESCEGREGEVLC